MSCESCQTQLFPYLYEVLEPTERDEVEAHLRGCPHCQVELERSRTRALELAVAVKGSFGDVVFKSPRGSAKKPRPAAVLPRVPRRPLLLNRWAIAAAVLVAVFSAGGVIAVTLTQLQQAEVDRAREQMLTAQKGFNDIRLARDEKEHAVQKDMAAIQREIDKLIGDWDAKEKTQREDLKNKRVRFEIKGPRSFQPGAPNTYEVQVKPANPAQPVKVTRVVGEVTNGKQVLFSKELPVQGVSKLIVPPDVLAKPGDDVALELRAQIDGVPEEVREHLTLLFPEYVTHLSTDRPMYRPGEVVHFRSLTLERFSLQPAAEDLNLRFRVSGANNKEVFKRDVSTRLADKAGRIVGPDGQPLHGLGAGEFTLPANMAGGLYTLSVAELNDRFAEEKRTFLVHRWQPPRFNKEAEFNRSSYGPGERVVVRGKVGPVADGGGMAGVGGMAGAFPPPGGAAPGVMFPPGGFVGNISVQATAIVDGQTLLNNNQNVDPDGGFTFDFTLPGSMTTGVGSISLVFQDGGAVETLVRPIPIVLRDVLVNFYPEGGDLVLGVPNRVYFQAYTGIGKPADIQGRIFERDVIVDKLGKEQPGKKTMEIARIQSLTDDKEPAINQGLGVFTFVPQAGRRYELKLDAPVGIAKAYTLVPPPPASQGVVQYKVRPDGVVLNLPQGVVTDDIPVTLHCAGKDERDLLVGAYCRGKLLDHATLRAPAGQKSDVVLHPATNAGGVYRVTVFEKQVVKGEPRYVPVAERLVFRKQTAQLHVSVRPDKDAYAPSDPVTLAFEARNEKKEMVPAVAMVAVVDASVAKLANDRTARSMPTHFLLTTEIRQPEDLENTDALLGSHPRAAQALDLLLGAQGWRRFAEQNPQQFAQRATQIRNKPAGFMTAAQSVAKLSADEQETRSKLDQPFAEVFVAKQRELAKKEREEAGTPETQQQLFSAQLSVTQAQENLGEHTRRLDEIWGFFEHAGLGVFAVAFVVFAFFLVSTGLHQLAEGRHGYIFLGAGLVLLVMLFVISVLGTFAMMGVPEERMHRFFGNRRGMGMAMKTPAPPMMGGVEADMPNGGVPGMEPPAGLEPLPLEPDADPNKGGPPDQKWNMPGGFNPNLPGGIQDRRPRLDDVDRQLREQGRYRDILERRIGRQVALPAPVDAAVVREYAHKHKGDGSQVRRDFAETLYWQPALVLKDGQGQVHFDMSDAVTRFQVLVVSHTLDGRLGADTFEIASQLPYSIEAKAPIEVTASDEIAVPVAVSNTTAQNATTTLKVQSKGLLTLGDPLGPLTIEAGQTRRQLFRFQPNVAEGKAVLRFQGKFGRSADAVERSFLIVPDGFPAGDVLSGTLQGNVPATHEIVMPEDWSRGTLVLQLEAYPSVLADLQRGVEALLREPHGCFEQASSSNYPNVLLLNYLQDTKQASPAVEKQARRLIDSGYHKLIAFECEPAPDDAIKVKHGYEWFGQTAPPHEALTAYGLMQFHDMARVYSVDQAMMQRTQKYLLDQRDAKGGFKRNPRAVDQFGRAPQDVTNAYIVWALTETGVRDELAVELDALYEQGKTSRDPYFIALAGLGQLNAARTDRGLELLRKLRGFQKESGEVFGARTSITSSAGRDLLIETTALSSLGWLRAAKPAEFQPNAQKAGKWLLAQRGGAGGFGSTQATVLALKSLIAFAANSPKGAQQGDLHLQVIRDNAINQSLPIGANATEPLNIQLTEKQGDGQGATRIVLEKGKNLVQVQYTGGNVPLPYTLSWSYRTQKPLSAEAAPLQLTTTLMAPDAKKNVKLKEGQTVKLKALLQNKSGQDQGMAVAVLGIPAGLSLPPDHQQLKELARPRDNNTRPGVISSWDEPTGRELVLYWRELKADAKVEVELDLICNLPGIYTGPASRAYLYYNADLKHWVAPLRASIDPAP